jgi:hypothetical protein
MPGSVPLPSSGFPYSIPFRRRPRIDAAGTALAARLACGALPYLNGTQTAQKETAEKHRARCAI